MANGKWKHFARDVKYAVLKLSKSQVHCAVIVKTKTNRTGTWFYPLLLCAQHTNEQQSSLRSA